MHAEVSTRGEIAMNFRRSFHKVIALAALAAAGTTFGCSGPGDGSPSDQLEESVQPKIKITGTIVDADGRPLEGVTVQLQRASKAVTTTASDGTYAFPDLHRGAFTVTPTLGGCSFDPPEVTLNGQTTD